MKDVKGESMETKDFLIEEKLTVIDAMKRLDETAKGVLYVIRDNRLAAAISDGDIRRHIISNGNLKAPVREVANYSPIFLYENDADRAQELMQEKQVRSIPIVGEEGEILRIVFADRDEAETVSRALQGIPVVIMAGGFGTRLYPYTKILPKPLIPIGDIPIAELIMNEFHRFGAEEFYLIVNYKKNMIKAYFTETQLPYKVHFVDEDKPLGTGGGLSLLKGKIQETFLLSNCDILVKDDFGKMLELHRGQRNLITMVVSAKNFTLPYGIVELDDDGRIREMREKPSLSFLTNTGVYLAESRVIDELEEERAIGFPEMIDGYRKAGERTGIYPVSEDSWYDMGQFEEMDRMEEALEK